MTKSGSQYFHSLIPSLSTEVVETSHTIRRPGSSVRVVDCALFFGHLLSRGMVGMEMASNSQSGVNRSDRFLSIVATAGEAQCR